MVVRLLTRVLAVILLVAPSGIFAATASRSALIRDITQVEGVRDNQLSLNANSIKTLVEQTMATPDVRTAKVTQLRDALGSGSYKVDTLQLANAMLADRPE